MLNFLLEQQKFQVYWFRRRLQFGVPLQMPQMFFNLRNASRGIPVTQEVKSSPCHPRNSHQWHKWNSHFFSRYTFFAIFFPVHCFHYLFHYSFSRYTFFTICFTILFPGTLFSLFFFQVHFFHTFFSLFFSLFFPGTLFFTLFFTFFFRAHFFHTFFSLFFPDTLFSDFKIVKKVYPYEENALFFTSFDCFPRKGTLFLLFFTQILISK